MAKISNTSKTTPIGLPCGTLIPPGGTADVPDWGKFKGRANLAYYVDKGTLKVEGGSGAAPDPEAAERDELLAKLKAKGVDVRGNPKLETLRDRLAELEKAEAGGGKV